MKIVLKSDFIDYYDHWFDRVYSPDERFLTFSRQAKKDSIAKWAQFKILENLGLKVPRHGIVKDIGLGAGRKVVVYHDPYAHAGEGKELLLMLEALERYPNSYCSEFIQCNHSYAQTTRELTIGYHLNVTLTYTTSEYTAWRSNVGDPHIRLINVDQPPKYVIPFFPLVAVDFVTDAATKQKYAIDLNTAPLLKWTGLEEVYSAKVMADLIKGAIEKG